MVLGSRLASRRASVDRARSRSLGVAVARDREGAVRRAGVRRTNAGRRGACGWRSSSGRPARAPSRCRASRAGSGGRPETFEAMIRGPCARRATWPRARGAMPRGQRARNAAARRTPSSWGGRSRCCNRSCFIPSRSSGCTPRGLSGGSRGPLEQLEGTLLDWVLGESRVLRQRAMTAVASVPKERMTLLGSQIVAILDSRDEEPWVLAAVAAATPYLFFERKDLWDRLAKRVLAGDGGAITARALARGLATLWRRGGHEGEIEGPLRALREMARRARSSSLDDSRRWIEVTPSPTPSTAPSATRSISSSASRTWCGSPRSTTTRRPTRAAARSLRRSDRRSPKHAGSRSARAG
jgi:hypothetical protein